MSETDRPLGSWVRYWLAGAIVLALFVGPKILMHEAGFTSDLDTGNYSNLAWGLVHHQGFYSNVLGRSHLGEHFSPIMLLLAPFYLIWPSANILMIAQGLSAGGALIVILWFTDYLLQQRGITVQRLGKQAHTLRMIGVGLLLVAAMFYKAFTVPWAFQFQPIVLGMCPIALAIVMMHLGAQKNRWADLVLIGCVGLLLISRESSVLSVLGLAIYALVLRRWKLAIVLAIVAGATAAVIFNLIMPHFRVTEEYTHVRRLGFAADWGKKSHYLLMLIVPLGFLPLAGWRAAATTLAALPGVALNVAVDYQWQYNMTAHYDAQLSVFLLIAAAHGLATVTGWVVDGPLSSSPNRRIWTAVTLGGLVLACALGLGGVTPIEYALRWRPTRKRIAWVAEARAFARKTPLNVPVAANKMIGPQVCHRQDYKALKSYQIATLKPGQLVLATIPERRCKDFQLARRVGVMEKLKGGRYIAVYRWISMKPPQVLELFELRKRIQAAKLQIRRLSEQHQAQNPSSRLARLTENVKSMTAEFNQKRTSLINQGVNPAWLK